VISKNARRVIIDDSVLPVIISLSITYVLSNFIGLPDKMGLDDAKYNQRHNQAQASLVQSTYSRIETYCTLVWTPITDVLVHATGIKQNVRLLTSA